MDACYTCNRPYEIWKSSGEHPYHYVESGLQHVWLVGVTVYSCPNCGIESADIPDMDGLHLLIAKDLIVRPIPMSGEELRFLRKEVRMTPTAFADRVGVSPKTVSNWEGSERLSKQTDIALRFLLASELFHGEELEQVLSDLSANAKYSWEVDAEQVTDAGEIPELLEFNVCHGLDSPCWHSA